MFSLKSWKSSGAAFYPRVVIYIVYYRYGTAVLNIRAY